MAAPCVKWPSIKHWVFRTIIIIIFLAEAAGGWGGGVGEGGGEGQVVMAGTPEAASAVVWPATSEGVTFCLRPRMMSTGRRGRGRRGRFPS